MDNAIVSESAAMALKSAPTSIPTAQWTEIEAALYGPAGVDRRRLAWTIVDASPLGTNDLLTLRAWEVILEYARGESAPLRLYEEYCMRHVRAHEYVLPRLAEIYRRFVPERLGGGRIPGHRFERVTPWRWFHAELVAEMERLRGWDTAAPEILARWECEENIYA